MRVVNEFEIEKMKKDLNLTEIDIFDPISTINNPFYKTLSDLVIRIDEIKMFNFFSKYLKGIKISFEKYKKDKEYILFRIIFIDLAFEMYFICGYNGIILKILFNKDSIDIYENYFIPNRGEYASMINGYIRVYDAIYNSPEDKSFERELIFEVMKEYPGISICHPYLYLIDTSFIFSDGERIYNDKGNDVTDIVNSFTLGNWKKKWYFNKNETVLKSFSDGCEVRLL